jgi:hypothetical protein
MQRARRSSRRDSTFPTVPLIAKPGTLLKPQPLRVHHRNLGIYESAMPPKPPPPREDNGDPPLTVRRHRSVRRFDFLPIKSDIENGGYVKRVCELCHRPFSYHALYIFACGHVCHINCATDHQHCPICPRLCQSLEIPLQSYEPQAAQLIQRVFRGFFVRSRIGAAAPPGSIMHRKWVLGRAQTASTMLADAIESQSDIVDAILASIDKELDWARTVMSAVDVHEKTIDGQEIRKRIVRKGCGACSVCLLDIAYDDCVVTSCEHCFHADCLNSWIDFCHKSDVTASCPVCRSAFQYRAIGIGDRIIRSETLPRDASR